MIEPPHSCIRIAGLSLIKGRERERFADRGFSQRTWETLIEAGYSYPEHLLFADPMDLRTVRGIGKKASAEVDAYRRRFLPQHHVPKK